MRCLASAATIVEEQLNLSRSYTKGIELSDFVTLGNYETYVISLICNLYYSC